MSCSNMRLNRLREEIKKKGLSAFFVRDLSNIKWLTGFDDVFDDEPAHSMMIGLDFALLHTDTRYQNALEQAARNTAITIDVKSQGHAGFVADTLKTHFLRKNQEIVVGIETSITLAEYRSLQDELVKFEPIPAMKETQSVGLGLRSIKDTLEIERLKAAQKITDRAFAHIVDYIKPAMTEIEIKIELEDYMVRQGATGLAFPSIVAAGANAANPHAVAGARPLKQGDAVVMDFGARSGGYCSDMTRTVFIGRPDERLMRAYAAIRRANEEVARMLKPGVTGLAAQKHAENVLKEEGFADTMGHSLGHGVGIDVHELPVLASRNTDPLEVGNVVTVEPGIYIPNAFGMRLEDFGVITEQGFDVFTQSTHDMVII